MKQDDTIHPVEQPVTLLQGIGSVLAATFGVQSSRHRERDFRHGKTNTLVLAGVIFVVLYSVVQLVLRQNGH